MRQHVRVLQSAVITLLVGLMAAVVVVPSSAGVAPAAKARSASPSDGLSGDDQVVTPPDHFDGPAPPAAPLPVELQDATLRRVVPSGGTWAVVIGIDDYPGTAFDLRSAVADANDATLALQALGVAGDHILTLRNGQATGAAITSGADWLVAHAAADAVGVFFYAGHAKKVGAGTEAVLGADGGLVSDRQLANHLAGLRAHRAWIAMAACFGGGFDELLGPGRVLTAAADAEHLAYDNVRFGRSYMDEYMVRQGLAQGRAWDSVQSAFAYAAAAIATDFPGRVPVEYEGDNAGPLDLTPPGATRAAIATAGFDARPQPAARPAATHEAAPSQSPPPPPTTTTTQPPKPAANPPAHQPAPAPTPAPTPSPTPTPGGGGSGGGGGGGGGGSGGGGPGTGTPPPTQPSPSDQCKSLTGGVVKCGG
ncbi:MAG: hypothetical protein QOG64_1456 [Acidimicrobiaceae bacterium]|nr:hypothetical protein [Acidimicrobiaceae bacterium]